MKTAYALTAAATIAAVAAATGTACADTPDVPVDVLPGIHYTANVVDHSVALSVDGGRLVTRDGRLEIRNDHDDLLFGLPLAYRFDERLWPIAAQLGTDGRDVLLTPSRIRAESIDAPGPDAGTTAEPIHEDAHSPEKKDDDFDDALSKLSTELGLGTSLGALIGSAIGLVGGCVAGALTVGTLMAPIFLEGAAGGCIAGAIAGAGLGGVVGTVAIGGSAAAVGLARLSGTLNAPAQH